MRPTISFGFALLRYVTIGFIAGASIFPPIAQAATLTVNVFTDTNAGGPAGTGAGVSGDLRFAILNSGAGDTIQFACSSPPCTITLNGPLPPITHNLTIDGGVFGNVVIDGNALYRVFFVDSGTVTIENLQIQNASAKGGAGGNGHSAAGGGGAGLGAGLFVNQASAVVTVANDFFSNNATIGGAGGTGIADSSASGGGGGGGGLVFAGGAGAPPNGGGGGGGGGVLGAGIDASANVGGNGGNGGGGGGSGFETVFPSPSESGTGGSGYAGNTGGSGGVDLSSGGAGGFGGGGGGGGNQTFGGTGGFGGGGGGLGSITHSGGTGGPGGGGGAGTSSGVGGLLTSTMHGGNSGTFSNSTQGAGGGGGAAAGPAIFVAFGSLTTTNSGASGASATGGAAGGGAGGASAAQAGTADATPVFNYSGMVNGSSTAGPIPSALMSGDPTFAVTVTLAGTGSGIVTGSPGSINCGSACSATYAVGTLVTLTASPAAGSFFAGFSGACTGTATCNVTTNSAQNVTATFTPIPSFLLTVNKTGTGTGSVTSSPSGIDCGAACTATYLQGTMVTLTAAPGVGSTFAGWSGGGCSGTGTCQVTMSAAQTVNASFVAGTDTNVSLLTSLLPDSRSAVVGQTVTVFATAINFGTDAGANCAIAPATSVNATFAYQTTNPATNTLTGTANTPVAIPAGGIQTFVLSFIPTAAFAPTNVALNFGCANAAALAPSVSGLNTLSLSASATSVPDIVAVNATSDPGYLDISPTSRTGAFAVATDNMGSAGTITVGANDGSANLPVTFTVCQTVPATGACMATPAASVTVSVGAGATDTFAVFATATGSIADMPAGNRVFVTFTDGGGTLRGETSVAVRTH